MAEEVLIYALLPADYVVLLNFPVTLMNSFYRVWNHTCAAEFMRPVAWYKGRHEAPCDRMNRPLNG